MLHREDPVVTHRTVLGLHDPSAVDPIGHVLQHLTNAAVLDTSGEQKPGQQVLARPQS
jgi:hypothetical protein